jgi:hypothetical protein
MSEPWALTLAHGMYKTGRISNQDGDYSKLIKSILRLQMKDEVSKDVNRLFIKITVWCSPQVHVV